MPFMPVAAFSDIQDRRSGHLWYLRQELVNVNASAFPIGLATTPQPTLYNTKNDAKKSKKDNRSSPRPDE